MRWGAGIRAVVAALLTMVVVTSSVGAVPKVDHEANCTWKELDWDDFRGPVVNGQQAAWIMSTIIVDPFDANFEISDDGVRARPKYPSVYAFMDKLNSGVRTGSRVDYVLAHEQLHFDITEIHARRFAVRIMELEGVGATRQAALQHLYDTVGEAYNRALQELGRMQMSYDGETVHGLKKKLQKKWAQRVAELLESTPPYPLR